MIKKLQNFLKYFWIAPTDLNGSWRFQLNIPIGKNPNKKKVNKNKEI